MLTFIGPVRFSPQKNVITVIWEDREMHDHYFDFLYHF